METIHASRPEAPDAAMEILFAFVETLTAPLPQWLRLRIARGVYKRLEKKTAATPIGSDGSQVFVALKIWRSRMIWLVQ